jgi:hypothetical protein
MNQIDDMLTQLFHDKPIAQESLLKLHNGVMDQILAVPIDFKEKTLLAQRRKWGFILLSILTSFGLGLLLLTWLAGPWFETELTMAVAWIITNIPELDKYSGGFEWLSEKWTILSHLMTGVKYIWQQYAISIMGIILVWVMFEGIRAKQFLREQR